MNTFKKIERDENGLIKGVNYVFNEDGNIDWRKMLKPEHLTPNRQKTKETDVTELQDDQLLILLSGIKYLAKLRGYSHVDYYPLAVNRDFVSLKCQIIWIANYEPPSEGELINFSATADACPENTNGFGSIYLTAIAQNRSFVRCVREFLGINIVGQDEVKPFDAEEIQPTKIETGPHKILADKLQDRNVSFAKLKAKLAKEAKDEKRKEIEAWQQISDIPKTIVLNLLDRIKESDEKTSVTT